MDNERYPRWTYYPKWKEPEIWVDEVTDVFRKHEPTLDSRTVHKKSNDVLDIVRNDLEKIGYDVEGGSKYSTIHRPVFFGEYGKPDLKYQIDSFNESKKIGLEIEAGRSHRGNAIYRDIIQTSLLVGINYFAIAVPQKYRSKSAGRIIEDDTYLDCKAILDAIYASERLKLPFEGVLLIGY